MAHWIAGAYFPGTPVENTGNDTQVQVVLDNGHSVSANITIHKYRDPDGELLNIEYCLHKSLSHKPELRSTLVFVCTGRKRKLDERAVQQKVKWAETNNFSICLSSYPSYGRSTGPVSEERIDANNEELLRFIRAEHGFDLSHIIVMGTSIGNIYILKISNVTKPLTKTSAKPKKLEEDFTNL